MSFSTNQWAILVLVLILGWLLGLMSRSGSGRWKRAYREEREARLAAESEIDTRTRAANERIAELEKHAPLITAGTAGAVAAAARGDRNDLDQINGIDRDLALRLNEEGVHGFRDVASLSRDREIELESRLGIERGRISRERWREQAAMLVNGRVEEHRAAFG